MSLVLMAFYWVVIPLFVFLVARWLWRRMRLPLLKRLVVAIAAVGFLGWFWLVAGEKLWLDQQVRELCAKDGGVRIYETVRLPPDKFNKYGQINFYNPIEGEKALGFEYVFKKDTYWYRKGGSDALAPTMLRQHYAIIRLHDGKVLGETVSYGRGGGDMPGPWHPSSFNCPEIKLAGPNALLSAVFISSNVKGE